MTAIGETTAAKILRLFGERALEVLENDPEQLSQIPGISRRKAMEIGELQGAMSSIALCVCGIITSVIAGFFAV